MLRSILLLILTMSVSSLYAQDHPEHAHADHDHRGKDLSGAASVDAVVLTRTPDIERALAAGGEPVVASVLGVVCDFCATAMNKIFGKRAEVAAVYVDLDTKALNLVMAPGLTLSDAQIAELTVKAGYKLEAVRRGSAALGS